MADIYLYKNRLWAVDHKFTYTGSPQEFTIPAGERLLICKGAKGGSTVQSMHINRGGVAYGIINLNAPLTAYAFVGGDGGNAGYGWGSLYGEGGYNGGGNGGTGSKYDNYLSGAGGGGATDIRVMNNDVVTDTVSTIPEEYSEVTYIESTGDQYINLGYIPSQLSRIECVCELTSNTARNYNCIFGSRQSNSTKMYGVYYRYNSNDTKMAIALGTSESSVDKTIPRDTKIKIVLQNNTCSWYDMDGELIDSYSCADTKNGMLQSMWLFTMNNNGSTTNWYSKAKVYSLKIYENSKLIRWFVPFISKTDNTDLGLYELVNGYFRRKGAGSTFQYGEILDDGFKTEYHYNTYDRKSLYYRIIVAGGGGGAQNIAGSSNYVDFTGFGGGVFGGYPYINNGLPNNHVAPNQGNGYSFGIGESAPPKNTSSTIKDYSAEGMSGGGGGWYGGYSPETVDTTNNASKYSSGNGGGGSGYVLTASSAKPEGYMEEFDNYEELYLTDTYMCAGAADEACVMILHQVSSYNVGDRIICESFGEGNQFRLLRGNYTVKCYGGTGGSRTIASAAALGGYTQGTFTNQETQPVYAYVGGSGLFVSGYMNAAYTNAAFPDACFNGGGAPSGYADQAKTCAAAGGGTDLRIGRDSLYNRIIVAGGGGGVGKIGSIGGAGGGASGGTDSGASYGQNYGPGTQTGAGTGDYPEIAGGFGYGGNGIERKSGFGGSGGGGWYGGSGTRPDDSGDDDRAGAGGSGYTFKDGSYTPPGYKLGSLYKMTDTILTTGGNDLPRGMTRMIIDVNQIAGVLALAWDNSGYKYFDPFESVWKPLNVSDVTPEIFNEYGQYYIDSDTGLNDNYEILVYDPLDTFDTARLKVCPLEQTIRTQFPIRRSVEKYYSDYDIDNETTTFSIKGTHKGVGSESHMDFVMKCNITDVPETDFMLYCIHGTTSEGSVEYHEPTPPKPPVQPKQYLLNVGVGTGYPFRYKTYMSGYIDGSTAISEVRSACATPTKRAIYTIALCNNTTVRLSKLNLVTNTSTKIKDIAKSRLGNTFYGDLKVDGAYAYITSSVNNGSRNLYRIPLDPEQDEVLTFKIPIGTVSTTESDYYIQSVGKMEWYDDHTLALLYKRGIALFDVNTTTWRLMETTIQNSARRDFILGKKLAMTLSTTASNSAYIVDLETNTWYGMREELGQTWTGTELNCGCYHDGKFYVTQKNAFHIFDEETQTITKSIPTPYINNDPKLIYYSEGCVYITIQNAKVMYVYDTTTDMFDAITLPFTMDNWTSDGWVRGCTLSGYVFLPQMKLFTMSFVGYSKYNLGYAYDQFIMLTNNETAQTQTFECDDRFVTFTDEGMMVHPGYLDKELTPYAEHILSVEYRKSEYNKFVLFEIAKNQPGPVPPTPPSEYTVYGWHITTSTSDPADAVTYLEDAIGMTPCQMGETTFDMGSWGDAFFMPRPCMLRYDGTVAYYLNPNDYTQKEDGTPSDIGDPSFNGNAMMEWPRIYYKFVPGDITGEGSFYVSDGPADDDYVCWCNTDCNGNITDHFYTAIYNATVVDTRLRSLSGIALTDANGGGNVDAYDDMTYAENNNTGTDHEWSCALWCDRELINALLILMGKSLDSQAVYGFGCYCYDQPAKEAHSTGELNDKGMFWGQTNVNNIYSFVKVFGMENWYGYMAIRTYGCCEYTSISDHQFKCKHTYGTEDGSTGTGYTTWTSGGYKTSDISAPDYDESGTGERSINKYISKLGFSTDGFFPTEIGFTANNTAGPHIFVCDNYWRLCWSGNQLVCFGASYTASAGNGILQSGIFTCHIGVRRKWFIGTMLSCKPARNT